MAISTSDGLVAAIAGSQKVNFTKNSNSGEGAGILQSYLLASGVPGAIATPSPGVDGEAVSSASISGFLPYTNAAGGNQKYLGGFEVAASGTGTIILTDMLWWNSGLNVTTITEQTLSAVTMAARDANGSSNGAGVEAGIFVSTSTTNGSAITNTTFKYTDSAGGTGKVGSMASFPATCVAGSIIPFQLAAGDQGVRAIESVTLGTSYGGGAIHLVLFRRLASAYILASNAAAVRNFFDCGSKLYDNSSLFLMNFAGGTGNPLLNGIVTLIEG